MRTPLPYSDESLAGYFLRLAESNYFLPRYWLLNLAGLKANQRLSFPINLDQPSRLSQLIKVPDSQLRAMGDGAFLNSYQKDVLIYPIAHCGKKLCPLCLSESPYRRQNWDLELVDTCPIHKCLLISQCPECQQELHWATGGVTRCQCGFDFCQTIPPKANSYQVNLALYIFAIRGDNSCGVRLKKNYGKNNPIFELTISQFSTLSKFLDSHLPSYLQECSQIKSIRCYGYNKRLHFLSSSQLVCYLFKRWRYNFKRLFDWYEHQLMKQLWEKNVLKLMIDFLTRLVWRFSPQSSFNRFISGYLKGFFQRHDIRYIYIHQKMNGGITQMDAELDKLDELLPKVAQSLNVDMFNLARLIAYSQNQMWILPDEKKSTTGTVIFINPYSYSFHTL